MSGVNNSQGGITRRSFLKASGAAAGALGLAGAAGMTDASSWLASASADQAADEKVVYTLHQFMCTGNCSLKCTVRDGRLSKIEPNDHVEKRYQRCCMKGISEIEHVYSPDRLQTPLKRVGERGANEFVPITWDEARDIIGEELKKAWDAYGKQSVYVSKSNEPRFELLTPLLGAGTGVEPGIDRGVGNGLDPSMGGDGFGNATSESRDWVNTKTLIMTGCNYLETSMMQASFFFDAKEAGCDIIVVDPHFSTTASKACEWVPIKPGTDPALFLGMVTYVLDNGLYDEDFMRKHTSFPFLVNAEDGTLLRAGEGETAYLVWDAATNTAVPYEQAVDTAALEGAFEVDGVRCTTVFSQLKATQAPYTTAWAAEKTGIAQEKIEELARKYATSGPSVIAHGQGGSDKYSNPDVEGHAIALLVALTGNVGIPGGSVGQFVGGQGYSAALAVWELPEEFAEAELPLRADLFPVEENDVHVIISLGNTLQQYYANMNVTKEWLKSLDFILHVGMYYEDSVAWADVVLPVCSKFEDTVQHGIVRSAFNHILLSEKCIDPLFESRPDFEVQRLILESVGLDQYLPENAEAYVRFQLENSEDPMLEGITLEKLAENHCSMPLPGTEEPRIGYVDRQFKTPTGRMEVYYENMTPVDQALPTWVDNDEVYEGNPLAEKYPLQLTQTRTRFFIHSHFRAAKWLQQFYTPYLEMNPADLADRGIQDGDVVEIFNDRGSFKAPVRANAAIRPGSSRIYEAAWSKHVVEGNFQNVTNNRLSDRHEYLLTGAPIPFNDTLVEVKKA